jgi:hypothetical protein
MPRPPVPPASRRAFLRLAALAPLAAAGCATSRTGPARDAQAGPPPGQPADPLAALRAVPLPTSAEPALVFRAQGGRGRCG